MKLAVKFVGAESNEQIPGVALYRMNASGQVAGKISAVRDGELDITAALTKQKTAVVALGPDVADISTLDSKLLLQLRVAERSPVDELRAQPRIGVTVNSPRRRYPQRQPASR